MTPSRLFEFGDRHRGWHVALLSMPRPEDSVGATWFRARDRFELNLTPWPGLTLFITRVKEER